MCPFIAYQSFSQHYYKLSTKNMPKYIRFSTKCSATKNRAVKECTTKHEQLNLNHVQQQPRVAESRSIKLPLIVGRQRLPISFTWKLVFEPHRTSIQYQLNFLLFTVSPKHGSHFHSQLCGHFPSLKIRH